MLKKKRQTQEIQEEILDASDWFIPNEVEFEIISNGGDANVDKDISNFASTISSNLIITLGEDGAVILDGDKVIRVPAPKVEAVDTTGAGDAFNGALAVGLSKDLDMKEALTFANQVAAISTTKQGAAASMPSLEDIKNY